MVGTTERVATLMLLLIAACDDGVPSADAGPLDAAHDIGPPPPFVGEVSVQVVAHTTEGQLTLGVDEEKVWLEGFFNGELTVGGVRQSSSRSHHVIATRTHAGEAYILNHFAQRDLLTFPRVIGSRSGGLVIATDESAPSLWRGQDIRAGGLLWVDLAGEVEHVLGGVIGLTHVVGFDEHYEAFHGPTYDLGSGLFRYPTAAGGYERIFYSRVKATGDVLADVLIGDVPSGYSPLTRLLRRGADGGYWFAVREDDTQVRSAVVLRRRAADSEPLEELWFSQVPWVDESGGFTGRFTVQGRLDPGFGLRLDADEYVIHAGPDGEYGWYRRTVSGLEAQDGYAQVVGPRPTRWPFVGEPRSELGPEGEAQHIAAFDETTGAVRWWRSLPAVRDGSGFLSGYLVRPGGGIYYYAPFDGSLDLGDETVGAGERRLVVIAFNSRGETEFVQTLPRRSTLRGRSVELVGGTLYVFEQWAGGLQVTRFNPEQAPVSAEIASPGLETSAAELVASDRNAYVSIRHNRALQIAGEAYEVASSSSEANTVLHFAFR